MGEIAEAMLDGDLCMDCGIYMSGSQGIPRWCLDCEPPEGALPASTMKNRKRRAKQKARRTFTKQRK